MSVEVANPADPFALATRLSTQHLCGKGVIQGYSSSLNRVYIIPLTCKKWSCPRCRPYKQKVWQTIIKEGHPERWFRLGANPKVHTTPEAAAKAFTAAWPHLVRLIRQRYGPFEYVKVIELHKSGFPHLHVAYRGPYVHHHWLSLVWKHLVSAPVVWIEKLDNPARAARYISKYMTKATQETPNLLPRQRFITKSRGWLKENPLKQNSAIPNDVFWVHSPRDVSQVIEDWYLYDPTVVYYSERTGLIILDLSTTPAGHPNPEAPTPQTIQKLLDGF
jgi:hypothetical protein